MLFISVLSLVLASSSSPDRLISSADASLATTTSTSVFNGTENVAIATPVLMPVPQVQDTTTTTAVVNPFVVAAGAALPSAVQCAKQVVKTKETRTGNATMNHTAGRATTATNGNWGRNAAANTLMARVDGKYTGTTDEIIQWAACKWGLDPNQVRAQAMVESSWRQTSVAGFVADNGTCYAASWRRPITSSTSSTLPVLDPLGTTSTSAVPPSTVAGKIPETTTTSTSIAAPKFECPTAFGILQLRADFQPGTYPMSAKSTAYNVDYALAMERACFEGVSWLGARAKGDLWGCVGAFYSGKLHNADADEYIAKVQSAMAKRSWS